MANTQEQMLDLLEREELPYADDASASMKRVRRMPKNKRFIPEESLNLLESYKPELREERQAKTKAENVEKMKSVGTGLLTGFAGLPSDIIEGVNFINDFLAEQGSPKALLFKDAINEIRKNYGREAFDKKFTEITGIKSDGANVSQIMGEILSPAGAFVATAKGVVKVTEGASKLYKFLKDNFELQNKLLTGNMPPGTGGAVQLADGPTLTASNVSGQMSDLIEKNKDIIKVGVDTAKGTKTVDSEISNNTPTINKMSMAGGKSLTGKKQIVRYRELEKSGEYNQDQLFEMTRVYRGQDGKFRWEIDTTKARIKIDKFDNIVNNKVDNQQFPLYRLLKFDRLYNEYPDAMQLNYIKYQPVRNIKVNIRRKAEDETDSSNAFYSVAEDEITLHLDKIESKARDMSDELPNVSYEKAYKIQLESTLLHEIQHAIQSREGFVKGSNTETFLPENYNTLLEKNKVGRESLDYSLESKFKRELAFNASDGRSKKGGGYTVEEFNTSKNIIAEIKNFYNTYKEAKFVGLSNKGVDPDTLLSTSIKATEKGTYGIIYKVLTDTKGEKVANSLAKSSEKIKSLYVL